MPSRRVPRAVAAAVLAVALVVTVLFAVRTGGRDGMTAAPVPTPTPTDSATPTVSDLAALLAPSLVYVRARRADGTSQGSGTVANADGSVLTAWHVVDGATAIEVTFADGTTSPAAVGSSDEATDTAVLVPQTLPSVVVPAVLGGAAEVGSPVVALGNPLGLAGTVTSGVVSGLGRSASPAADLRLSGLIQFDAAVNPGSSGGPLVGPEGTVLGVVVALANPAGDDAFAGIGFAVPIGAALGAVGGGGGPQL